MPWAKIDDDAPTHPKFVAAGSVAAFGFWVAGNCYCNKRLTDGFITTAALTLLSPVVRRGEARRLADRLVAAGLWATVEDGYQVHDFLEYNPSAARVGGRNAVLNADRTPFQTIKERRQNAVPTKMRTPFGTMPTRARLPDPARPIPPSPPPFRLRHGPNTPPTSTGSSRRSRRATAIPSPPVPTQSPSAPTWSPRPRPGPAVTSHPRRRCSGSVTTTGIRGRREPDRPAQALPMARVSEAHLRSLLP